MLEPIKWWGYRHVDGSLHIKRFFDRRDLEDAWESDFVVSTYGPIEADTKEEATQKIVSMANGVQA